MGSLNLSRSLTFAKASPVLGGGVSRPSPPSLISQSLTEVSNTDPPVDNEAEAEEECQALEIRDGT
jgi:hypothetical protein